METLGTSIAVSRLSFPLPFLEQPEYTVTQVTSLAFTCTFTYPQDGSLDHLTEITHV